MAYLNKKSFISLVLGLIFAPGALLCSDWLNNQPIQENDLVAWYQKNLNQEEQNLQTELFTLVDIKDRQEWEAAKRNLTNDYDTACATTTARERAQTPLPQELIIPLTNVLNNPTIRSLLGITSIERDSNAMYIKAHRTNGKTITFACGNKKIQADAATDQYTTLLDPEELLQTHSCSTEIEATLAHELMHIAHEDDLNVYCLNQIHATKQKTCRIPKKQFARLKGQWERLQEKRADILAGAIKLEYATASKDQFERNTPRKERAKITDTHPTQAQRASYMSQVVIALQQTQPVHSPTLPVFLILISLILLLGIIELVKKTKKHC